MNINENNGPVAEAERITREAAIDAEVARWVAEARQLRRRVTVAVACMAAVLVGWNWLW